MNVLLLSTGYSFVADGNFGLPHLVSLASYAEANANCSVHIVDLDYERHLPQPNLARIYDAAFDVIGISCYSSFEYLKAFYLGVELRKRRPDARMVVGGYHPSACPEDFTGADSPFDHVVIGEGERPLERIIDEVQRGVRVLPRVLGPEVVADLDSLPPMDWSKLSRYLGISRKVGNQVTMSLSRGCPFRCAFCMEAAKGSRSWRAFSPARAEEELRRLDAALPLAGRTLFLTDPLFGLKPAWRGEMLERMGRLDLGVRKFWALSRADVLSDDDLRAFNDANFGLGFGLESGDVGMLDIIHKGGSGGGSPADYLERFERLAAVAGELDFPWGANVIVGHPGETEESLVRSAQWLAALVENTPRLTGFISIDPYRYYPGSPIHQNIEEYERRYGTVVYRKRWWNYSEPAFTATWLDPSRSLDYRTCAQRSRTLFAPIAENVGKRFSYGGAAADYFRRSVESQRRLFHPVQRLHQVRDHALWRRLCGDPTADARQDTEAASLLAELRVGTVSRIERTFAPLAEPLRAALLAEPRERYLPEEQLHRAARDEAIPLDDSGKSTISALHAYALNYSLLDLQAGDRLLELGTGTGYGAALAARVVGEEGFVRTVEIDEALRATATKLLGSLPRVEVSAPMSPGRAIEGCTKVLYTFALAFPPVELLEQLPDGGRLLAPIGTTTKQTLTLFTKVNHHLERRDCGEVRYVLDRSSS